MSRRKVSPARRTAHREPSLPAKVTTPRADGAVPRPRLFAVLDRARTSRRVAWVHGPAGSGKTTLVASWLRARRVPNVWYQADAGDADIATFFLYLRAAAARYERGRTPLPLLPPSCAAAPGIFARRYVETLFERLPPGAALVIDDAHEVPADAPWTQVLSVALRAVPQGSVAIVLSRVPPPPEFARDVAHGDVCVIEWDALRLTRAETAALAQSRRDTDGAFDAHSIHEFTDGWAAGVVAALRHRGSHAGLAAVTETLFDYFALEVFAPLAQAEQRTLTASALVPSPDEALLIAITGDASAPRTLSRLVRARQFTERTGAGRYRHHSLLREFLLAHADDTLGAPTVRRMRLVAAEHLLAAGDFDNGLALLVMVGDRAVMTAAIRMHAPVLVAQGRHATLERLLGRLSTATIEADGWLSFWRGVCSPMTALARSARDFARAFVAFREAGDVEGLHLAWAGAVRVVALEGWDVGRLDPWIERYDSLGELGMPSIAASSQVASAMTAALVLRAPGDPRLSGLAERARDLAMGVDDLEHRLFTASQIFMFSMMRGDSAAASAAVGKLATVGPSEALSPLARVTVAYSNAHLAWASGSYESCLATIEAGLDAVEGDGASFWAHTLAYLGCDAALRLGRLKDARRLYDRLLERPANSRSFLAYVRHCMLALCAVVEGDPTSALTSIEAGAAALEGMGSPWPDAVLSLQRVGCLLAAGLVERAADALESAAARHPTLMNSAFGVAFHLLECDVAFARAQEDEGLVALRRALSAGAPHRTTPLLNLAGPAILARQCARALEHGLETDYAAYLASVGGVGTVGQPPLLERWPWTLRVYALGDSLSIAGANVSGVEVLADPRRSVPSRLLLAIIALADRQEHAVRVDRLSAALWPDASDASRRRALDTTLHRLRAVLGDPSLVTARDGRILIDTRRCWIDAWASAHHALIAARVRTGRGATDGPTRRACANRLLDTYRGPLGSGVTAEIAPWLVLPREQLEAQVIRGVTALGLACESAADWSGAVDLYHRALNAIPSSPVVHAGLIRSLNASGRHRDARRALTQAKRALDELPSEIGDLQHALSLR